MATNSPSSPEEVGFRDEGWEAYHRRDVELGYVPPDAGEDRR